MSRGSTFSANHADGGGGPADRLSAVQRRGAGALGSGALRSWRTLYAVKALFVGALLCIGAGASDAFGEPSEKVSAISARLEPTSQGGVLLRLALTRKVDTQDFVLSGPDRVVIDFPEVSWDFDAAEVLNEAPAAVRARGVRGVRTGLFRMGRSRMVLDLDAPMSRGSVHFVKGMRGATTEMRLELQPLATSKVRGHGEKSGGLSRRAAALETARAAPGAAGPFVPVPRPRPPMTVIAIDPGHGGRDKGAHYGGVKEKHLVLAMAKLVRKELESKERVKVVLTRERDRFIKLEERVDIARQAKADLFVSLHADALKEHPNVSGASFYTLSDKASDSLAARLAKRENEAVSQASSFDVDNPWIRKILVGYAKRRRMGDSEHLVERMVKSFKQSGVPLIRSRPHREAGFLVLKNFDQPSVLIELGFLTNIRDQRRFDNPAWRKATAEAIAAAILRWAKDRDAPALAGDLVMRADARAQ